MSSYLHFDATTIEYFWRIVIALLCGTIIGTERVIAHKIAGMRTYALVSAGAAFFVCIGQSVLAVFGSGGANGYLGMLGAIITGIGFMGAGIFMFRGQNNGSTTGLTTASGLWVAAGIGMACGLGLVPLAIMVTILTLFVFVVLWYVEQGVKKVAPVNDQDNNE